MKIKEIPASFYHTIRLKSLSVKKLLKGSESSIPVIVSLTTIPSRVSKVEITIRSILMQTQRPSKILLWLPESLKDKVPKSLKKLENEVFEIRFSHLTCSHKKLIHSLKVYPDQIIITCDDDFIYNKNWLSFLYQEHLKYPDFIIANQARMITYDQKGNLLPYKNWKYEKDEALQKYVLPIGANGVLYPPNSLHATVFEEELFLKLAPKADDLWFKAMGLLNNTQSRLATHRPPEPIPIMGTQQVSLKKENIDKGRNVVQWKALKKHFGFEV